MPSLHDHPFGVDAFFRRSSVLTFTAPPAQLAPLLPPPLSLDLFEDRHAFLAVAMVDTRALRPTGFPAWLGSRFFLVGYRLFVRYTDARGRRLRGLYILRSETDSRAMQHLGSLFTRYRYHRTQVDHEEAGDRVSIRTASGLDVEFRTTPDAALPLGSPFESWKEARRFAGPLPFTFSYDPPTRKVLIVEGVREHWQPQPVEVLRHRAPMADGMRLASAFTVTDIPYHWKKGRSEVWTG